MEPVILYVFFTHLWNSKQHRYQPYDDDELHGSGKFRHALRHERMTNGHVSLNRERGYGKYGSVCRHFGKQSSELTEYLAEHVRISVNMLPIKSNNDYGLTFLLPFSVVDLKGLNLH